MRSKYFTNLNEKEYLEFHRNENQSIAFSALIYIVLVISSYFLMPVGIFLFFLFAGGALMCETLALGSRGNISVRRYVLILVCETLIIVAALCVGSAIRFGVGAVDFIIMLLMFAGVLSKISSIRNIIEIIKLKKRDRA
jgi:hypothetical protein